MLCIFIPPAIFISWYLAYCKARQLEHRNIERIGRGLESMFAPITDSPRGRMRHVKLTVSKGLSVSDEMEFSDCIRDFEEWLGVHPKRKRFSLGILRYDNEDK